ncbi:MAG: prenyltransferase [bacterium]|nr:MAG: prenyltransferase [bacterium]
MRTLAIWWQAFRFHFVPPSYMPAILGGIIAWAITGKFYLWYFIVTVVGVTINHVALNMTDDYFDYKHSIDRTKDREKNPYSGGSGTLTSGLIQPGEMYRTLMTGYLITIILGFYLTAMRGWWIFIIGAFGMGCAYYYTAPPIRYGYRGFGELSQLINFSLTIGLGSYYVQAQQFCWEAMWAVLPLGFMMFSMITINEIPDEADDRAGGKKNLVVRFGTKTAVWLYGISMTIAFLIIIITPLTETTTFWIYLSLITLPWFINAFNILYHNYHDAQKMSPANMLTIRIHNLTAILLITGYLVHGILNGQKFTQIWGAVLILILLYLPVVLTVFIPVIPVKPSENYVQLK